MYVVLLVVVIVPPVYANWKEIPIFSDFFVRDEGEKKKSVPVLQ